MSIEISSIKCSIVKTQNKTPVDGGIPLYTCRTTFWNNKSDLIDNNFLSGLPRTCLMGFSSHFFSLLKTTLSNTYRYAYCTTRKILLMHMWPHIYYIIVVVVVRYSVILRSGIPCILFCFKSILVIYNDSTLPHR